MAGCQYSLCLCRHQSISEAKEEWFRSSFDDPAIVGMEAAKAAQAQDVQAINAAFPAPAPTAKPT